MDSNDFPMPNFLSNAERMELLSQLRSRIARWRQQAITHPRRFREAIRLQQADGRRATPVWLPWQLRDFAALDPAWLALAFPDAAPSLVAATPNIGEPLPGVDTACVRRAYLERPRGHSKTTDIAVQLAWILQAAQYRVRGLAAAADREQAALIHTAASELIRGNPLLCPDLQSQRFLLRNRRTHSQLDIISSDLASSWGLLPDFVICDELCHWRDAELWHSLASAAAKKPGCLLVVLTNAGTGTGWQWQVRESARTSARWYFHSLDGVQVPWITATALEEQAGLLPPAVFQRLWLNRWQHSDGEFVTLAEAEACRDVDRAEQDRGSPERCYVAAIDYAEKRDRTVGVVIHREGSTLVVDRMDVAVPTPLKPVPVRWVREWIERTAAAFAPIEFILDEYQLIGTIQELASKYALTRFDFAGGKGNQALATTLRRLIVERQVRWYSGCGQVESVERDDLETELASLVVRMLPGGRMRIDHRRESGCHDDRAFALGAACLHLLRDDRLDSAPEWLAIDDSPGGEFF